MAQASSSLSLSIGSGLVAGIKMGTTQEKKLQDESLFTGIEET